MYEYRDGTVSATHYNHVKVALRRSRGDVRLAIPRLKTLDLILQADAWIVVDRAFNDLPVVAWTDFRSADREGLHAPVPCRLRLFNAFAGVILKRTLEAMDLVLGERFESDLPENGASLLPFRRPRDV